MSRTKLNSLKLFLLISPFMVLLLVFCYYPLYGWIYAFYDFRPPMKLSDSEFVGLYWFKSMIENPVKINQLLQVFKNTLVVSSIGILFSWLPMAFAIFLSELNLKWFSKIVQTLTTLPNFISWVLVFFMAFSMFSTSGVVNTLLADKGFIEQPIQFLQSKEHIWIKMWLWGVWKGLGWGAIMYLAAISGLDQELFEAARVDGANRFKLIRHITIPGLLPTYFVLLILSLANFLNNGLEQYFMFQNSFNKSTIQVLDLYVYNIGMTNGSYSLATAFSMFKSLFSVVLLFSVNKLSLKVRGESIV